MSNSSSGSSDNSLIQIVREPVSKLEIKGLFEMQVVREDETIFDQSYFNQITDLGVDYLFSSALNNSSDTVTGMDTLQTVWYIGLISGTGGFTPVSTNSTLTAEGLTEFDTYAFANRPAWSGVGGVATVPNASASQPTRNISNAGNVITYVINATPPVPTIQGTFITNVLAKGSESDALWSKASLSGTYPTVQNNDNVLVTYTAIINA